jgi:hypothetical protein
MNDILVNQLIINVIIIMTMTMTMMMIMDGRYQVDTTYIDTTRIIIVLLLYQLGVSFDTKVVTKLIQSLIQSCCKVDTKMTRI